jgi:hypothetical protein
MRKDVEENRTVTEEIDLVKILKMFLFWGGGLQGSECWGMTGERCTRIPDPFALLPSMGSGILTKWVLTQDPLVHMEAFF